MVLFLICLGTVKQGLGKPTASKYGLKQNHYNQVTNFMDFAAKAVDTGGVFSKEQVAYLNKNATIYRDSRAMLFS